MNKPARDDYERYCDWEADRARYQHFCTHEEQGWCCGTNSKGVCHVTCKECGLYYPNTGNGANLLSEEQIVARLDRYVAKWYNADGSQKTIQEVNQR